MSFFSISLLEYIDDEQVQYNYYKTIQDSKQVHIFFLNCSLLKFLLHHILGKMKFDSLVHLILKYLLGYVMIDHIVLTITRKVNFLSFRSPRRMIVWKVAAFGIGLDLYDEVLASSGVF